MLDAGERPENYDVAIVGAGPAGLSAALYAARFNRSVVVLHDNTSRAARIPLTQNVPGFDEGVAGPDLLARMSRHAAKFGAQFVEVRIDAIHRDGAGYGLDGHAGKRWRARAVILATGIELNQIPLDHATHEAAIAAGQLRYCPVCDGYEHRGAKIAVVGCSLSGAAEALFLKTYSSNITLLTRRDVALERDERSELEKAGIRIVTDPVIRYEPGTGAMRIWLEGIEMPLSFDVLYPALGSRPRNALAKALGIAVNEASNVSASATCTTEIPGLFCAGDLVDGLDQISVAMGHGATAATKAHNWLRRLDIETVESVLD